MEEVKNILSTCGSGAVKQLQAVIRSKATASGRLAHSVRFEIAGGMLQLKAAEHLQAALFGRGPGGVPSRKVIEQWIDDKGIVPAISKQSLAYLIQRKIAEEGTPGALGKGGTIASQLSPSLTGNLKTGMNRFFKNSIVQQLRSTANQ